jgi:hypothetical protein
MIALSRDAPCPGVPLVFRGEGIMVGAVSGFQGKSGGKK